MTAGESEFTMSTKSEIGRLGIELADLRQEQETIEAEVGATAQARDARTKEYKASKRRRQQTFRDGVPVYEDSWVAEDEAHEAMVTEAEEFIQASNRRSQELGRVIEERRQSLFRARNRAKAAAEVAPVAPLEAEINTARAAYESLAEELASIPAELEEAHRSADAEAIVAAQLRARDLPIHVAAARTALLNAQARHAEAMAASFGTELQAAEDEIGRASCRERV